MINNLYHIAFLQRKFVKENALDDIVKSFQLNVWLLIVVSLIILTLVLSIKSYLLSKDGFLTSFSTSLFHLFSASLSNTSGKL